MLLTCNILGSPLQIGFHHTASHSSLFQDLFGVSDCHTAQAQLCCVNSVASLVCCLSPSLGPDLCELILSLHSLFCLHGESLSLGFLTRSTSLFDVTLNSESGAGVFILFGTF